MNLPAEVFTDGSCHTQKCIGAWASIVFVDGQKTVLSGKEENTTHNRMEIVAVIKAIEYIQHNFTSIQNINIVSDSQYVIGLIGREVKFESKNFLTNSGNEIRNIDLVKELLELNKKFHLQFIKIKAHQKKTEVINYNIEVDKLCREIVREAVK
ncbi:MAG: ribonuclease H [Bacteroidota bacterium]|nr:ribonuclease H [Bacteroidota bacterium]